MDGDPPPRLQGPWPPATRRDHRSSEHPPQERRQVLVGGQAVDGGGLPERPDDGRDLAVGVIGPGVNRLPSDKDLTALLRRVLA